MAIPLRQSTGSQEIPLGYFLDSTDGNTEETALTIANTDIKLWKMGATTLANKNSGGATHISNGIYYAVLDATDSNTLGGLIVFVHVSGALPVRVECEVMTANRYDSLVAGTDTLHADLTQMGGVTQSATDLKDFADAGYIPGTHKVNGVVLVDTTSTNTDMVGTANAALAATALTDVTWTDAKAAFLDHSIATVDGNVDTLLADWTDGGRLDLILDIIAADTTTDIPALINALNNISSANVNTEVVDVIRTDTSVEPVQGAPSQTPTLEAMIKYIYFRMINKTTTTSTTDIMFKADGATEVMKSTIGDDGTTFTKAAYVTGT